MESRIPTREMCNQDDPRTAFKWAFVAWPLTETQPFTPPPDIAEEWSQRLWELGFRHHPDLQSKRIAAPHRGQQHPLNNSSVVVDVDAPDPEPVIIPDMTDLTAHEQAVVAEQLYQTGVLKRQAPPRDTATVVNDFNPGDHSPSTVNGYLMAADEATRRRVLAAEMTGKRRDQILRKWKGQ